MLLRRMKDGGSTVTVRPEPLAEVVCCPQGVLKVAHKDGRKDSHDAGYAVEGSGAPPGLV